MKIKPNVDDLRLTRKIFGFNEDFKRKKIDVIEKEAIYIEQLLQPFVFKTKI